MDTSIIWTAVRAFIVGYAAYAVINLLVAIIGFVIMVLLIKWLCDRLW